MLPTDIQNQIDLYEWQQVPVRVGEIIKVAKPIARTIKKVIRNLPASDYGYVYYHPENHELMAVLGDGDDESTYQKWHNALKAIKGITRVRVEAEIGRPGDDWVLIKKAQNPLGILGGTQKLMGSIGGASPMTNAMAGALLTGGLGYGTGWLLEHLFPERFVRRGKLRKTLGLAGAGLGAMPGVWQWGTNAANDKDGGLFRSLWKPNKDIDYGDDFADEMDTYYRSSNTDLDPATGKIVKSEDLTAMREWLGELPPVNPLFDRAAAGLCKIAEPWRNQGGAGMGGGLRPVPMDAFNRAIWNDVRAGMAASKNPFGTKSWQGDNTQSFHTPPPVAAATSAINTGIQDMYGGRSMLSPMHFIKGLATAGVDLATAHVVGGTLGALGGLQPEAQRKLQDFGLWGGLLRGTVGSMMGMR